ncbi:unnamed protein product [Penicillium pancosmium]
MEPGRNSDRMGFVEMPDAASQGRRSRQILSRWSVGQTEILASGTTGEPQGPAGLPIADISSRWEPVIGGYHLGSQVGQKCQVGLAKAGGGAIKVRVGHTLA